MAFTGPLINAAVVLLAGIFGSFFKKGISSRITETVTQGFANATVLFCVVASRLSGGLCASCSVVRFLF